MIASPKNFIEQFQNFIEHIAGLMKTFLTKEVADNYYLGKTAKAVSANTADTASTATKATQDANGNVIPETYATKSELTSGLATKQPVGDYRTKSELDSIYLGINAKAKSAEMADVANAISGEAVVDIVGVDGENTITTTSASYEVPCDAFVEAMYKSSFDASNGRITVYIDGMQIYATAGYSKHPEANVNRFIRKGRVLSAKAFYQGGYYPIDVIKVNVYPLVLYTKEVTE